MKKSFTTFLLFLSDLFFLLFYYLLLSFLEIEYNFFDLTSFYALTQEQVSLFLLIIMLLLIYEKIYTHRYDFWEETRLVLKALFLSFVIILSFLMLVEVAHTFSKGFLLGYFLSLALVLPIFKRIVKRVVFKNKKLKKRVKIIGNEFQKEELSNEFEQNWYLGYLVVRTKPEAIFIASKDLDVKRVNLYIKRYSKVVQDIYVLPFLENVNFSQSKIIEYFNIRKSAIKIENNLLKKSNRFLKDLFEKVAVVFIFPFFLLLHCIISFLIKKDSKSGKVFFIQERIGLQHKTFLCYKYRTMLEDTDEILHEHLEKNPKEKEYYDKYHKYLHDPRITTVGAFLRKTSLDELPQLINVLKGEMSLIGPRPYMLTEKNKIGKDSEMIFRVKPGISGLWQVSGRSELSFEERKKLDVWYIQNWSLWMDIVILLKTIKVVFLRKGAL